MSARLVTSSASRLDERGQSLIEFAVVLPLIVLLVFGALDVGRAVFTYNTLAQAAREGNRVAIVNQTDSAIRTRAIASAASLGLANGNIELCFKSATSTQKNCSAPTVDTCPASTRLVGCLAIVTARSTYTPMTPVIGQLWSSISLTSTSIAPIEYVCPATGLTTCP